ncbi:hypothetical protein ACO1O0_004763, partial [Amphichorda felina]
AEAIASETDERDILNATLPPTQPGSARKNKVEHANRAHDGFRQLTLQFSKRACPGDTTEREQEESELYDPDLVLENVMKSLQGDLL